MLYGKGDVTSIMLMDCNVIMRDCTCMSCDHPRVYVDVSHPCVYGFRSTKSIQLCQPC